MFVVSSSTGSEFHSVVPETAKLRGSVLEEQQDFRAQPIVDAGIHCRLVKSYRQCMKEHLHAGTCRQEHQVCTGFFDGLEASAIGYVDRSKWDLTSAFSRPGGCWL